MIRRNYFLPDVIIEKLEAETKAKGIPEAELIRRILEEYYLKKDGDK